MAVMGGIYQRYPLMGSSGRAVESNENNQSKTVSNSCAQNSNAYKQYQQNSINTASPQELTLMLFNGLVRYLKVAHEGIAENNIEKANNNIIRSQDIIIEFASTLDMQFEMSNGLLALYDYMNWRLIEANLHKDNAIIEEIIGYAEELRDIWAQAMKVAKQQAVNE
jgi:flagellar protein FliS